MPAVASPARLRFTKMQGAGNDFVVIDTLAGATMPDATLARRLADRRFGIGCDQIMVIEAALQPGSSYSYRILNADGSLAGQCGNGARCVAQFLRLRYGLVDGAVLDSPGGPVSVHFRDQGEVELALAVPKFAPAAIPFVARSEAKRYRLDVLGGSHWICALSMGNPHALLLVEQLDAASVAELGSAIETHPRFPDRCNVGFAQILNPHHLRLRVWERGVGETLACGSGACAAVVALSRLGLLQPAAEVDLPGGRLSVRWPGAGQPVYLAGPAHIVFDGEFPL